MKTFALKVKDSTGTVYTPGFIIADTKEEAVARAKREWGGTAWAEFCIDPTIETIDDLISHENMLSWNRFKK